MTRYQFFALLLILVTPVVTATASTCVCFPPGSSSSSAAPASSVAGSSSASASASASAGGEGNLDLPNVLLLVPDQVYVNATRKEDNYKDIRFGGAGPFYRNFPFNPAISYTKESFWYSIMNDAVPATATVTASCEVGITTTVTGYPTISMGTISPFATPTATGGMYLSCSDL
ncbi:hypothetical protein M231_00386 [Tremella mesenterica]|uniref:Ubiquitin 3 binding protein But2 C-terminal domain-containing protein n=1 Tax=Tremella mesenterica TaxID=5217 RepID=A0A4Q1BWF1_TREME|nr:hypothetical protein M231_00386 [Tremella mesenterica]